MVLPDSRFDFRSSPRKSRRGLVFTLVFVVVAGFVGVAVWRWDAVFGAFGRSGAQERSLEELWDAREYESIVTRADELLQANPMNQRALIYRGFSYFYWGAALFSVEERIPYIDESIVSLRKAKLFNTPDLLGSIEYVLGKAYHFKGKYYEDLTIQYLLSSIERGYKAEDTYEYLGLAFSEVGNYTKSATYFKKAVEQAPTDMRYLALAQAYLNGGEYVRAEEYLLRTLNKTQDQEMAERSRFLLGKLYMEEGELARAEEQYRRILESNPDSADAHFYLGEVYFRYGNDKLVEARAQWRKAYQIDKSHYGARLRLF